MHSDEIQYCLVEKRMAYVHVCLGHSTGQYWGHNNTRKTHRTDKMKCLGQLEETRWQKNQKHVA